MANLYYLWLDVKVFSFHLLKIWEIIGNQGNDTQLMDRKWLKLFIQKNSTVKLVLPLTPLEKLFETLGKKKPFECRMYTWVYFRTENFYVLLGKMIFTSSYLKLLFLKTRNLALYYLYCLVYYLVEGPIERAACFALHCKKNEGFH